MDHEDLKLERFLRWDFELELIFKFFFCFQGLLLDAICVYDVMQHVSHIRSSSKERVR
jgi:hypothetical protein